MAALNKKLTEEFFVVEMANITGPGKSFSGGLFKSDTPCIQWLELCILVLSFSNSYAAISHFYMIFDVYSFFM